MSDYGRILKHPEMCQTEGLSLQKGMNYCPLRNHSILLMSRRKDAPYRDRVEDSGLTLIYEGHDVSRAANISNPKIVDQPQYLPSGKLTENGKFFEAAMRHKLGKGTRRVRVYEKLREGIWADNGNFNLVDAWQEADGSRKVFKFKLVISESESLSNDDQVVEGTSRTRIIPSSIKQEVWLRDGGKCTLCDSATELHFDHVIPYSKGGSSLTAENIQLLCVRHNLEKRDKIE
jgi:hypothetical protein